MVRRSEEERGFSALLEQVRHEQKLLIEEVQGFGQKLDRAVTMLDRRDHELDGKVDLHTSTLIQKLSTIDQKTDHVGAAVTQLSARVEAGFSLLTMSVHTLTDRFDIHEHTHTK